MPDTLENNNERFMEEALKEAEKAAEKGEVPIGAVAVLDGNIVARAHNLKETNADPTAHAELLALREAAKELKRWRLGGVKIYSTLEPCAMCAGAMVSARIDELIFAAPDPKAGAVVSLYNIGVDEKLNHNFKVTRGVLEDKASELLKEFFKGLRAE